MSTFTLLFLIALSAALTVQLWLAQRQIRHVRAHRDQVPAAFAQKIMLDSHRKAADYTIDKTHLEMFSVVFHGALLLVWTLGGGIAAVDAVWQDLRLPTIVAGAGTIFSVLMISALLEMPLSLYATLIIEERHGFNRTTLRLFLVDTLKEGGLGLMLGLPLVLAVLWLMSNNDLHGGVSYWWLYVWFTWLGFSLLISWLYPLIIAPLFNTFTPLDPGALRERIETLLARAGFTSKGIFVVDGSRRSSHGNAYFTGLGRHKRIVFYDTLLQRLGGEELEAVLAHELGHYAHHHIRKRWVMMALFSLGGLWILDWLRSEIWFYHALGVATPSPQSALLLFMLCGPVFMYFLTPLLLHISRRHEFEADRYAAVHSDSEHLSQALIGLYNDNAATLTPDPWYSRFHDSHPPAPLRVAALQSRKASILTT